MHVWTACMNSIHKNPLSSNWIMVNIKFNCIRIKLCLAHCSSTISSVPVNFKQPTVMSLAGPVQVAWHTHDHVGIGHLYHIHWSTRIIIIIFHGHQPPWRIILVPSVLHKHNVTTKLYYGIHTSCSYIHKTL